MGSVVNFLQNFGTFAEMLVRISQIDGSADERDVGLVVNVRFAQPCVDQSRFVSG